MNEIKIPIRIELRPIIWGYNIEVSMNRDVLRDIVKAIIVEDAKTTPVQPTKTVNDRTCCCTSPTICCRNEECHETALELLRTKEKTQ